MHVAVWMGSSTWDMTSEARVWHWTFEISQCDARFLCSTENFAVGIVTSSLTNLGKYSTEELRNGLDSRICWLGGCTDLQM